MSAAKSIADIVEAEATIIIGIGTPFEERISIRKDLKDIIAKTDAKDAKKAIDKYIKNITKKPKGAKGAYWCEVNAEIEPYCMSHVCITCPANKMSIYYNPDSKLVRMYKEGKIESRFDSIEKRLGNITNEISNARKK